MSVVWGFVSFPVWVAFRFVGLSCCTCLDFGFRFVVVLLCLVFVILLVVMFYC